MKTPIMTIHWVEIVVIVVRAYYIWHHEFARIVDIACIILFGLSELWIIRVLTLTNEMV